MTSTKQQKIFLFILMLGLFPLLANAISNNLKRKYPYTVLTDDYGILNEIDLNSDLDGVKKPPLFSYKKQAYIYWQCFPRESVTVSLEDLGYSPEDDIESDVKYNGENDTNLTITVKSSKGIYHKYVMYRSSPITLNENRFNLYLKLMQGEKNVCLAGEYLEKEKRIIAKEKQFIHYWAFHKIKTLRGCEAYHKNGCHDDRSILSE